MTNDRKDVVASTPTTAKYTTDLTQLGHDGRLRENLNFEAEMTRLIEMLGSGGLRQPVILNDDKANPETIIEQLALRIAKGNVPTSLLNKRVVKLETAFLFSTAKTPAEAEATLKSVISEVAASKGQIILYVDELQNLCASDEIKNVLIDGVTSGDLKIVGASGIDAYHQAIEPRPEVANLFAGILVNDAPTAVKKIERSAMTSEYRGDNISPDLRQMMAKDPSGKKRVDVIIQAKNADNAALRSIMADGRCSCRPAVSDTMTHWL